MRHRRKSGVLLHPTSLPGPGGIGSLGKDACRFVDFLQSAGQSYWQVLPLGPAAYGNSPYSSYSAFAGNPLLINLETVLAEGDLAKGDLAVTLPAESVDYERVELHKYAVLRKAAASFFAKGDQGRREEFWRFCDGNHWLHDYGLFMALKEHFQGKSWCDWPVKLARREPQALKEYTEQLGTAIGEQQYLQWQFFKQWGVLKLYANERGVEIIGDIPIFVAFDSADVWAHLELFHLDERGRPTVVAGVPPDYFSKTGQLWGNPLYNWEAIAYHGFGWWIERFRSAFTLYDTVRVDHFRGFEACWEVPAGEKTAVNGRWVKGPGENLFNAVNNALGELPIIAEDLGVITPEVEALRDRFGFPGMKILQFAFGSGPDNIYLPHNHIRECVVYTGTHDNDTTLGWFGKLPVKEQKKVVNYLGTPGEEVAWELIRAALASVATTAIIPLQDLLGLGSEGKMNTPGTSSGNWTWRFPATALSSKLGKRLHELTELYGRAGN